jgi:hypothetical protein
MAVLVEALSVIVRRELITRRYPGGWPGFVADAANQTLCADCELARIGFMHPDDVGACVRRLEGVGFVFLDDNGSTPDTVVVDQREGPTTPCSWIEFFRQEVPGGSVAAARLVGSADRTLTCPDDWEFEDSLSRRLPFALALEERAQWGGDDTRSVLFARLPIDAPGGKCWRTHW